jgi:hypothetical protein
MSSTPPAGWYTNPSGPGRRYWDGEAWTEHIDESIPVAPYQSAPSAAPPPTGQAYPPPANVPGHPPPSYAPAGQQQAARQGASSLVTVGYIMAVLFPIVGVVLGIVAATRPQPQTARHGIWIIVVSIAVFLIGFAILSLTDFEY